MGSSKIIALVLLVSWRALAAPAEFEQGNQQYDQGRFAEAKAAYEKLAADRDYSANLFYNLGNADVRLQDLGGALLNYERALALDPHHPEARANLAFVRGQTGAQLEARGWEDSLLALDGNSSAVCAAIGVWVALGSLLAIFFLRGRENALLGTLVSLGVLASAYGAAGVWHSEKNREMAIVTAKRGEARFAPADNSTLADTLPTGSHVRILNERGPWIYCELPKGSRAWISAAQIERIRPA